MAQNKSEQNTYLKITTLHNSYWKTKYHTTSAKSFCPTLSLYCSSSSPASTVTPFPTFFSSSIPTPSPTNQNEISIYHYLTKIVKLCLTNYIEVKLQDKLLDGLELKKHQFYVKF